MSHRSGETEDTFIADLVVGLCTGQVRRHTCPQSFCLNNIQSMEQPVSVSQGERVIFLSASVVYVCCISIKLRLIPCHVLAIVLE